MASVDLRLLRYFLAVAEEAHLTKAAERLGIRQPPLSQQIRALEQELGVTLFNRLPRGMELTESGRALLADARNIIALVDQAVDGVRQVSRGEAGRLTVGFTGSAAFHPFVPSVIRRFRDAAPNVRLVLEESSTGELTEAVAEGRVDAAFIRGAQGASRNVVVESVLEETMLAAFPADHPMVRGRPRKRIALSELAEESFILYRRHNGPGLYDAVISACAAAGFSPRMAQEAPRMLSTLSLVAAGLGVSLVPASLRRVNIEGVVYVSVTQPAGLRAPLNLIWRDAPVRRLPQADRGSAALPRPAARLTPGGATLCGCRILSRIFHALPATYRRIRLRPGRPERGTRHPRRAARRTPAVRGRLGPRALRRKTTDYVRRRAETISDYFVERDAKAIVVACNTATAAAIADLRARHPGLIVIGVEPAIKPAAHLTASGVIGVFATTGTLASRKFAALVQREAPEVRILLRPCPEVGRPGRARRAGRPPARAVEAPVRELREAGADVLVLGCTHFPSWTRPSGPWPVPRCRCWKPARRWRAGCATSCRNAICRPTADAAPWNWKPPAIPPRWPGWRACCWAATSRPRRRRPPGAERAGV